MKTWAIALLTLVCLLSGAPSAAKAGTDLLKEFDFANVAKEEQSPQGSQAAPREMGGSVDSEYNGLKMMEAQHRLYECIVLSVAMIASLWIVLRVIVTKKDYTADHIVSVSGLFTIVFGVILLVLLADAEEQLTASMGILGAIAGYLFGTMKSREPAGRLPVAQAKVEEQGV